MKSLNKLCIVSHVTHYLYNDKLYAYGPYAREIDIWADIFPEIVIAAPYREEKPPKVCTPFDRPNISISPQVESGGDNLKAKVLQSLLLPKHIWRLRRVMKESDAVHVRCPGSLGLMGVILAPLFADKMIAKYAGQWNAHEGERKIVKLQRTILKSSWWKGPVTVYGKWQNQPPHIIPFFTSMMSKEQIDEAVKVGKTKIHTPLRVLFSGRLAPEKRIYALLEAAKIVLDKGIDLELTIVGNGGERENLQKLTDKLNIQDKVKFVGDLPYEKSLKWYEWADCLVLPSKRSEGWAKVLAEAMCYGITCIAVSHGQLPFMLENKGILLENGSIEEIANALTDISGNPNKYLEMGRRASEWSRKYSIEGLRDELTDLLSRHWNVSFDKNSIKNS